MKRSTLVYCAALIMAILSIASPAWAVTASITQQGRLFASDGEPMSGQTTLDFRLYDAETGGDPIWSEEIVTDLDDSGFYSLELGGESNPIDAATLQGEVIYLGLAVNGAEELTPRLKVTAVPYAIWAEKATAVADGAIGAAAIADGAIGAAAIGDGAITNEKIDTVDWSKITNVPAAQDTLEALNCNEGDAAIFDGTSWSCKPEPKTIYIDGGVANAVVSKVSVRAFGTCGTETEKPQLGLYINRKLVNTIEVANASASDFDFAIMPPVLVSELGAAFLNDGDSNGCDRDLSVESITINDAITLNSDETHRVVFDKNAFFDNLDVVPGQVNLAETGVLRFFVGPTITRPDEFVPTDQSCPAGQFIVGFDPQGAALCGEYTGNRFALSDKTCPPDQLMRGVDNAGEPLCTPVAKPITCPPGEYLYGIDANGNPRCRGDRDTTYSGADFALSNRSCAPGQAVQGISATGTPICDNIESRTIETYNCSLTGYVNNFDGGHTSSCGGNRVMIGFSSYHDNGPEDRRFRLWCCDIRIQGW